MIAYDELVSALALWRESNGLGAVAADYLGAPPAPEPVSFAAYDNHPAPSDLTEGVQDEIEVTHDDYHQDSHNSDRESVVENLADPLAEFSDESTAFEVAAPIAQHDPPPLSDVHSSGGADALLDDALLDDALFDVPLDVDESSILDQQDISDATDNEDVAVITASAIPIDDVAADLTVDQEAFFAEASPAHTELASGSTSNLPSSADSSDIETDN